MRPASFICIAAAIALALAVLPRRGPTQEKEITHMVKQVQTPQSAKKSMGQRTAESPNGAMSAGMGERDEIYGVVSVIS